MFARLTAITCIGALATLTCAGDAKKTDPRGDALPDGAIARMGTTRWRHAEPVTFVAFPNAKTLLTASQDHTIRLWDRETGKEIRRYNPAAVQPPGGIRPPVAVQPFNPYGVNAPRVAVSNDGKVVASILPTNAIQLWEIETGKEIRQLAAPRNGAQIMAFSPDGKLLGVRGADRTTTLIDVESGKERQLKSAQAGAVRVLGGAGTETSGLAFSADGKTIAVAELDFDMNKFKTYVRLSETDTAKEIRTIDAGLLGVSALAYSPEKKWLALATGNGIQLRDADTAKEVRTIDATASMLLVFSPDSKTLAAKGRDQVVRVFDVESGKRLHEIGSPGATAVNANVRFSPYQFADMRDVAYSPDGKVLAIGGGQAPRFFDVGTGKQIPLAGGHSSAVTAVAVSADGKTLFTRGADNVVRRWNAATGEELGQFAEPSGTIAVRFSPDGSVIAFANSDGAIRLHGVAPRDELRLLPKSVAANFLAFAPDGKLLAARGSENVIRIYSVEQGSEVKQLTWTNGNPNAAGGVLVRYPGVAATGQPIAFSPDGQTVAAFVGPQNYVMRGGGGMPAGNPFNYLRVWDVATGKEIRQFEVPAQRSVINLAFSPDGRIVAMENTDQTVSLVEMASGKERANFSIQAPSGQPQQIVIGGNVARIPAAPAPTGITMAYSQDGAFIACRGAGNSVRIWDIDNAKEAASFKGHDGAIVSLTFAADGKTLASGSADTTALVWDLTHIKREAPATVEIAANTLDSLWNDLRSDDAVRAGKAVMALRAAPKQALPMLKERVKPADAPDVAKIDQWIRDLDSTNFPKRTTAIQELEKLGELALPALRKVLASSAPLETRRRVEPLIEKLTTGTLTAEQVRTIRAIEVLDKIGSAESRAQLEVLSRGAPGALTTRHAQQSLDRVIPR